MRKEFVVIGDEGHTSYNEDGEPESFGTYDAAAARALEMSATVPGEEIGIYQRVDVAIAEVGKPKLKKVA